MFQSVIDTQSATFDEKHIIMITCIIAHNNKVSLRILPVKKLSELIRTLSLYGGKRGYS